MAKATYLLRKASELVREKRYSDAVEVYLRATETAPSDSRAWFGLGVCLFRVGNLDVARIALQRAQHMGYPRAEEALTRVEAAERRRQAEGLGAKATVARAEAARRAAQRPVATREPPPRPAVRPDHEKIELVRPLRIMLVEEREKERQVITRAIEGSLKNVDVVSVPYGVSTSETMSGTVHYDVAVLDWDWSPDATAGLIQILKIKRPTLFVICMTEEWDPETAVEVLEAGADYHMVKNTHFASTLPLIIAQCSDRDYAVVEEQSQYVEKRTDRSADVLNALGEMLLTIDSAGIITQANTAALTGIGLDKHAVVGQAYFEVLYNAEEPPESCPIARALDRQEEGKGEISLASSGNALDVRAWPVRDQNGGAVVLLAELAEPAAGEVPTEWSGAAPETDRVGGALDVGIDSLECGLIVLDAEGRIMRANALAADLLGVRAEDLAGRAYLDTLREVMSDRTDDAEGFVQTLSMARDEGVALMDYELAIGGESLRYFSTPVENGPAAGCRVEHFYAAAESATVYQPAAQAPAQPLSQLAALVPDMLFTVGSDGVVTWCNEGAAVMTGRRPEQLTGRPLAELAVEQEPLRMLLEGTLRDGRPVERHEIGVAGPEGRRRWAEVTLLPLWSEESGAPNGAQGLLHDVTDRKMTEAIRSVLSGA